MPVSSAKRPMRSVAVYHREPSEAIANWVGVPLARGRAHSVCTLLTRRPMRLFCASTHHTPVPAVCIADRLGGAASSGTDTPTELICTTPLAPPT